MLWRASRDSSAVSDRIVVVSGPGLEHSEAEAHRISSIYGETEVIEGDQATCDRVAGSVEGARLVHLACHGTLRADSPTFSGFRLSDGPMTVHDLDRIEVPAHEWVLAACDLGNPGTLSGPDLEGVLASLLGGGAGAVVAAVTPVPDDSSVELMTAFHTARAGGKDMAEALRAGRRQIDADDPRGYVTSVAFNCYGGG
jgi:CHAT domain-containing protein